MVIYANVDLQLRLWQVQSSPPEQVRSRHAPSGYRCNN